jgi:hypothetical protein
MPKTAAVIFAHLVALATICHGQQMIQTVNLFNNNVFYSLTNNGQSTQFYVTTPLGNGVSPSDAWLAIGFNDNPKMVDLL